MGVDIDFVQSYVFARLSERYYLRSVDTATLMTNVAEKYDLDPKQAQLAGMLHLVSRQLDLQDMIDLLNVYESKLMRRLPKIYWRASYLTAPASAWFARDHLGLTKDPVFHVVREHTALFKPMTKLGKCLFLASVLTKHEKDDPRAAVILQAFMAGQLDSILKELNKREIMSLEKTDARRQARITNPDFEDSL